MSDPTALTPQQEKVWRYIAKYHAQFGHAPTQAEICEYCEYNSTWAARKIVKILDRKGYLHHRPHGKRSILLNRKP